MTSLGLHRTAGSLAAAALVALCIGTPALASEHPGPGALSNSSPAALSGCLYGVDATSHTNVWAVGELRQGGLEPLIEHSDGTSWSRVPISGPGGRRTATLESVNVLSPTSGWAVGYYWTPAGQSKTMIVRLSGSTWTQVASPNPGVGDNNMLLSVSADSATDAWATGWYNDANGNVQPLMLRWNGTAWTAVAAAAPGGVNGTYPYGIKTLSPTNAWMVGNFSPNDSSYKALIEHWNGRTWTQVASPNPAGTNDLLMSVDATTAGNVWAVGSFTPSDTTSNTLIAHFDGSQWTKVASPSTGTSDSLNAVSVLGPRRAWAVGETWGTGQGNTLTERWNGTSWTTVSSPSAPGPGENKLQGVVSQSPTDAVAVGYYYNGDTEVFAAIFEHWNGTSWVLS